MMTRFWTAPEAKLIKAHYEQPGGIDRLVELLPHRTRGAIYQQGIRFGLKAAQHPHRIPHATSEHIDSAIRFVYQNSPQRNAINELAQKVGRPRWWVSKRARVLGLVAPRFREAPWSEAEVDILEQHAHRSLPVIRRILERAGYRRTETAISVKRKRVGASQVDPNQYSAHALSQLMGVDGKTVTRWIEKCGLPAKRRGTERTAEQGGDMWSISRRSLRTWIAENAAHVDLRKVDKFWFIDLMSGRSDGKEAA